MILQVIYKLSPDGLVLTVLSQTVQIHAGREHFTGRDVCLEVFYVFLVVSAQAQPGGPVEEERHHLENYGHADVQVSVGHVVVQQTGTFLPALRAPEKARGVDPRAKYQRWGNESCKIGVVGLGCHSSSDRISVISTRYRL